MPLDLIDQNLPDNTNEEITPAKVREVFHALDSKVENIPAGAKGDPGADSVVPGPQGDPGTPADLSAYQAVAEKGQASGYAGLDVNGKVNPAQLPPTAASPHHIFASQADMLAGGAAIKSGDRVLVHGDPAADNNGEYVALQDNPTSLVHYDHLGEHVAPHRHDSKDVDVVIPGHTTEPLTAALIKLGDHLSTALQQDGSVDATGVPFVSLNSTQVAALKSNTIYIDETQKLMHKDNSGVSHPLVGPAHLHGTVAPDDANGADGDLYFEV